MASHAIKIPAASVAAAPSMSLPRVLAKLPMLAVMAVAWLLMLVIAPIVLAATLVHDAVAFLLRGGRPAPAGARRATFLPSIF